MISKSWLFLELSMYSDNVAKKGDISSPPPPFLLVFITVSRSEPYDLRVHSRGCSMIFAFSDSAGETFETGSCTTGTSGSLLGDVGLWTLRSQRITRATVAMEEDRNGADRRRGVRGVDSERFSGRFWFSGIEFWKLWWWWWSMNLPRLLFVCEA